MPVSGRFLPLALGRPNGRYRPRADIQKQAPDICFRIPNQTFASASLNVHYWPAPTVGQPERQGSTQCDHSARPRPIPLLDLKANTVVTVMNRLAQLKDVIRIRPYAYQ